MSLSVGVSGKPEPVMTDPPTPRFRAESLPVLPHPQTADCAHFWEDIRQQVTQRRWMNSPRELSTWARSQEHTLQPVSHRLSAAGLGGWSWQMGWSFLYLQSFLIFQQKIASQEAPQCWVNMEFGSEEFGSEAECEAWHGRMLKYLLCSSSCKLETLASTTLLPGKLRQGVGK